MVLSDLLSLRSSEKYLTSTCGTATQKEMWEARKLALGTHVEMLISSTGQDPLPRGSKKRVAGGQGDPRGNVAEGS